MLKLDTHSIQMIAICTILISTIFLGYLEVKRLHYKLDTISNQVKVIEDLNTIKNPGAPYTAPNTNKNLSDILPRQSSSHEENIVNKIFNNDKNSINIKNNDKYDNLDNELLNEINNITSEDLKGHPESVDDVENVEDDVENVEDDVENVEDDVENVDDDDDVEDDVENVEPNNPDVVNNDIDDNFLDHFSCEDGGVDQNCKGMPDKVIDPIKEITIGMTLNNELNNKKLKELRAILKERNLSTSGTKTECINRIIEDTQNK